MKIQKNKFILKKNRKFNNKEMKLQHKLDSLKVQISQKLLEQKAKKEATDNSPKINITFQLLHKKEINIKLI